MDPRLECSEHRGRQDLQRGRNHTTELGIKPGAFL